MVDPWPSIGLQEKGMGPRQDIYQKYKETQRNVDGSSAAFILDDMEFRANGNKRINQNSNKEIDSATMVNVKWRFKKKQR